MIQRQMWTSLGLGALSIAFIALPGSSNTTKASADSSRLAESSPQEVSQPKVKIKPDVKLQGEPVDNEVYVVVNDDEDAGTLVRDFDEPKVADDDNLQIFMGAGGGWLGVGVSE